MCGELRSSWLLMLVCWNIFLLDKIQPRILNFFFFKECVRNVKSLVKIKKGIMKILILVVCTFNKFKN